MSKKEELFSMELLEDAGKLERSFAEQASGCYRESWCDASAVMVRRLVESLIIKSFSAQGRLEEITEPRFSHVLQGSGEPTVAEISRFLEEDFPLLEAALNVVWSSETRGSPLMKYAAASTWNVLVKRYSDIPDSMKNASKEVIQIKGLAQGGTRHVTRDQLRSAQQKIIQLIDYLSKRFSASGVEPPSKRRIMSLARLIEKYKEAEGTLWILDPDVKPALKKVKDLGRRGAHNFVPVSKGNLRDAKEKIEVCIKQLVETAYPT